MRKKGDFVWSSCLSIQAKKIKYNLKTKDYTEVQSPKNKQFSTHTKENKMNDWGFVLDELKVIWINLY